MTQYRNTGEAEKAYRQKHPRPKLSSEQREEARQLMIRNLDRLGLWRPGRGEAWEESE